MWADCGGSKVVGWRAKRQASSKPGLLAGVYCGTPVQLLFIPMRPSCMHAHAVKHPCPLVGECIPHGICTAQDKLKTCPLFEMSPGAHGGKGAAHAGDHPGNGASQQLTQLAQHALLHLTAEEEAAVKEVGAVNNLP